MYGVVNGEHQQRNKNSLETRTARGKKNSAGRRYYQLGMFDRFQIEGLQFTRYSRGMFGCSDHFLDFLHPWLRRDWP